MVFVVSEFTYGRRAEAVPFIVGPALLSKHGSPVPTGTVFSNTRVAGLHPYRGGRVNLAVVLCQVKRDDYPRRLLKVIESAADAIDFGTALTSYVKIGSTIIDGVEALFGAGDTVPLMGMRTEFDPDAGDDLRSTHFALINKPGVRGDQLYIRDNKLFADAGFTTPYRDADYVLYSLVQTDARSDDTTLPFYELYERILTLASQGDDNSWQRAKADLVSLRQTMILSPDLTSRQADALFDSYVKAVKDEHDRAGALGNLRSSGVSAEDENRLRGATDLLNL